MEQDKVATQVKQLQSHFFGQRYAGASFSDVRLSGDHTAKVLGWLKSKKGLLVLSGPAGCGKTYLCSATVAWLYGKVRDICAHRETDFISKVKSSFDMKGDSDDHVRFLIDHEFYIYDDLGSTGCGAKEEGNVTWKQKVWFIMIEERIASNMPTVITTNYNRKQVLENLGERSYSRLFSQENCIIEMFGYPDLRNPLNWREDAPSVALNQKSV
jgi:DNA replication protein DnaC